MKLDLTNFAYELSSGQYRDCTLGDALAKEFAVQCISEFDNIQRREKNLQREKNLEDFVNSVNNNNVN